MGMAEAIRQSAAPKVFIANPIQDAETTGMSAGSMAEELVRVLREHDSQPLQTLNCFGTEFLNPNQR